MNKKPLEEMSALLLLLRAWTAANHANPDLREAATHIYGKDMHQLAEQYIAQIEAMPSADKPMNVVVYVRDGMVVDCTAPVPTHLIVLDHVFDQDLDTRLAPRHVAYPIDLRYSDVIDAELLSMEGEVDALLVQEIVKLEAEVEARNRDIPVAQVG